MADEIDAGLDKQKILAEIGASASLPGTSSITPTAAAAPAPASPDPAAVSSRPAPAGRLARHRNQIAALVLAFASLLWLGVGLATHERAPLVFGGVLLGLALLAAVGPLLRGR